MTSSPANGRQWTFDIAELTLLLADFRIGAVPRPFTSVHPYTTDAERAEFRSHTQRRLARSGLLTAGELDAGLARNLSVLAGGGPGIVVMGTTPDGPLLARGCWQKAGAVLATRRADAVVIRELRSAPLADAVASLLPDAEPAPGKSITVPGASAPDDVEREPAIFDDLVKAGPWRGDQALAAMFRDPVVGCGAFVPFSPNGFLPPVTWFDFAATDGDTRDSRRRCAITRPGPDGTEWTTYLPGDTGRIVSSLRVSVEPLFASDTGAP